MGLKVPKELKVYKEDQVSLKEPKELKEQQVH